jgi:hypothetical protein
MEHLGFTPYLSTVGAVHGEEVLVTQLTLDTWKERGGRG